VRLLSSREILSPRGVDLVQDKERDDKKTIAEMASVSVPKRLFQRGTVREIVKHGPKLEENG
jgi:hypothetical protein